MPGEHASAGALIQRRSHAASSGGLRYSLNGVSTRLDEKEYRHFDLWAAYHAFRLDPRARNWQRLRRRNVPWQNEQTVEGLLHRLCPVNGKRTPDPNTVGLALVTASSNKKKR